MPRTGRQRDRLAELSPAEIRYWIVQKRREERARRVGLYLQTGKVLARAAQVSEPCGKSAFWGGPPRARRILAQIAADYDDGGTESSTDLGGEKNASGLLRNSSRHPRAQKKYSRPSHACRTALSRWTDMPQTGSTAIVTMSLN